MEISEFKAGPPCGECGAPTPGKQPVHGCDQCGKILDMSLRHTDYLDATVFFHTSEARHHHLCSVDCAVRWAAGYKPSKDYNFIQFPLLIGMQKLKRFQKFLRKRAS